MSGLDDLSFSIGESELPHQRTAYRALVRGLLLKVDDDSGRYNVYDISSSGCSIQNPPEVYDLGRLLTVQLEVRGAPLVRDLSAKVVRVNADGSVACTFVGVTRQQELILDKLVLEVQKLFIAYKKI